MSCEAPSTEPKMTFVPLASFVSPSFWHKLAEIKLEHDRLSDTPKQIYGYYTNRNAAACYLEVDYSSFNSDFKPPKFNYTLGGTLYNKNTIEEFKECNKIALIHAEGCQMLQSFASEEALQNPGILARFTLLSFADLKSYKFYYWFAFPCPKTPSLHVCAPTRQFSDIPQIHHFAEVLKDVPHSQQSFFILKDGEFSEYLTLKEFFADDSIIKSSSTFDDYYFCFADPSKYEQPSWLMRIYVAFLHFKSSAFLGKKLKFLSLRYDQQMQLDNSRLYEVMQTEAFDFNDLNAMQFVGWEMNDNRKMQPRFVSMLESMEPETLADNMVNLNLKLMKWRLVPELNLEVMADTKCLLFGAGTLGCAVARNLLAWGFKHITFIDYGFVGHSNPVRQSLYTHKDALSGKSHKATTAANHLKEINPKTVTAGYVLQIPMPGHTIGETLREKTETDLNTIKMLVQAHDVLFLLTDSRESRWLPTILAAASKKFVINAALGFDSYLVMRHGWPEDVEDATGGDTAATTDFGDLKCISGNNLGCYFCNDVTAPGNSLKDRTLDQQCTVTRPGVSNIAASYAVELLVSILNHPKHAYAPAYFSGSGRAQTKQPEGLLGIIPHSIRGQLCNYENILPATQKFMQCTACSKSVINEYRENGNDFLFKVFESAKYLEDLTGISDYKNLQNEIIDFNDSDLEISDDDA